MGEDQTPDINMSYRRNLKFNAYTMWRVAYIFKLADFEPDCITYKSDSLASTGLYLSFDFLPLR